MSTTTPANLNNIIPLSVLTQKRLSCCLNVEHRPHLIGKHLFTIAYIDEIECPRTYNKITTLLDAFETMVKILNSNSNISFVELYVNEQDLQGGDNETE